jgi:hypothetical protein
LLFGLLIPAAAGAQWAVNGNPVCTATGAQDNVRIAANGLDGAVMVWQDNRGSSTDIYARQIWLLGPAEWTPNGVALCTAAGNQINPKIVHDGFGYLLYTWEDYRSGTADIYAAITDRLGNIFTQTDGFAISTAAGAQQYSALTTNSLGMAYVAWADSRAGNNDIYAQAFNVSNHAFWTGNGLAISTAAGDQAFPALAPDGTDGLYLVWDDLRNGNHDIYGQHVNISGQLLWSANAGICVQSAPQTSPMIVSDGAGGVIIAWQDQRNGVNVGSIYAQHVNAAGSPLWSANGIPIAVSTDIMVLPKMISDGAGGAIVVWEDYRNFATTGPDVYAQRVNGAGSVLWAVNGAAVCTAPYAQSSVDIAPDGANGVVVAWQDAGSLGPADVYAQRMNAAGSPTWTANGIPVSTAAGNQFNVAIAQSDAGGSIVSWEDRRTGGIADVYAQRIDTGLGQYGHPEAYITSIVDVPNDQGGFVRIAFQAGDGDLPGVEYEIHDYQYPGDVVGLVTGDGSASYTADVLTWGVGVPNGYYIFSNGYSNVVQGTSFDNLAPPAPTLSGQRSGLNVNLSWNSTAGDIANYTVERADMGVLTTVATTSYTDTNPPHIELHYRVRATDVHGNAGPLSNEVVLATLTGVEDISSGPKVLTVLPNSPNPFHASTAFRFGMPKEGRVQVEVYDAAGRRVASHDLGQLPAGWRDLTVDGRDDGGHLLASGVYFCRVSAAGETHTSKMVIRR